MKIKTSKKNCFLLRNPRLVLSSLLIIWLAVAFKLFKSFGQMLNTPKFISETLLGDTSPWLFQRASSTSYRLTCGVSARRQDPDSRIQIALNFRAGGSHQGELKSLNSRRFKRNHHKTSSG